MEIFFTGIGLLGAFLIVSMYFLLERDKIDPKSLRFFSINGFGAFLVMVSIAVDFDITDAGGVAIEACWVLISLMGIIKSVRKK